LEIIAEALFSVERENGLRVENGTVMQQWHLPSLASPGPTRMPIPNGQICLNASVKKKKKKKKREREKIKPYVKFYLGNQNYS